MKKKFFSLLLVMCLVFTFNFISSAQSFQIGFKGGISIPNLKSGNSDNPISSGYGSRLGPNFAIFGEFSCSKLFSVQPQIEYSSQGGKKMAYRPLPLLQALHKCSLLDRHLHIYMPTIKARPK